MAITPDWLKAMDELKSGTEIVVERAFEENHIVAFQIEDLLWKEYPDRRRVLCFRGEPILEVFPMKIEERDAPEGRKTVATQNYRILIIKEKPCKTQPQNPPQ